METPPTVTIDGVAWHHSPPCLFKTRAAFTKDRLISVESANDWSAYRDVELYFRPTPSEGLYNSHWWRTDVKEAMYYHADLVRLGRVKVSPQGTFA